MKNFLCASCALAAFVVMAGHAWADDSQFKIGGTFYFDYFVSTTEGADEGTEAVRGFQLRRSYLTVKKSRGDMLFRYTSDIDTQYGTGNLNMYTKYAYLERKCAFLPGSKLILGLHSPQTHGWTEQVWHYRSMEKTLSDMNKWTHSAQLGVGLQGKAMEGAMEYYLDLNNGNGYKSALAKDGIGFSGRLAIRPLPGLLLSGMFSSDTPGGPKPESNTYLEGTAGYGAGILELYAQYGVFTDGNDGDLKQSGMSFFGRAAVMEGAYLVARFDLVDPNTDADEDGRSLMIFGADFEMLEGLYFQPSYRITSYEAEGADDESELVVTFFGEI